MSIDVHNMRENPSLVPEKMVAFKMNPLIEEKNVKNFGQSAAGAKGGHPAWSRVSLLSVDTRKRYRVLHDVFASPLPRSLRLPSVKSTQDATCEASLWPHRAMATLAEQRRAREGRGQKVREQGGSECKLSI